MSARPTASEKQCARCRETKPAEAFRRTDTMRSGLYSYCKPCEKAKAAAWYRENPDKVAAIEARRPRRSYSDRRASTLRRQYGMTWDDYHAMVDAQGGLCAICGTDSPGGGKTTFYVDHDHASGKVRGLLCNHCNLALGHLFDDAERLRSALRYLQAN